MSPEYSISYAIPWVLLAVIYIYLTIREYATELNIRFGLISAIIFLFFFGLRGFVGWDYANYYPSYMYDAQSLFAPDSFSNKMDALEWDRGYSVYMLICKTFFPDYHAFVFFSTLIDTVLLYIFFKKYSLNISLGFLLFIIFSSILEIDTLRNIKSLLICLLAIDYIIKRSFIKFIILISIAITFHYSAILFLPTYFFVHKRIPQTILYFIFIIGNLFYFFSGFVFIDFFEKISIYLSGIFLEKSEIYIQSGSYDIRHTLSFGFIERTITWILLLITNKRIYEKRAWATVFINFTVIYLSCYFLLANIEVILTRIGLLFSFSYWIIYPMIFEIVNEYKIRIFRAGVIVYFVVYCIIRSGIKTSIMDKYENIIFNPIDYEYKMIETSAARENHNKTMLN